MAPDLSHDIEVVRTHLELPNRAALRPAAKPGDAATLDPAAAMAPDRYLQLYTTIGGRWHWTERLHWSPDELDAYLRADNTHIWILRVGGVDAGYFELQRHAEGHAEVMYFGLAERFIGQGLGGWMLTRAVEEAFALGASRVILNTCTLDAPGALPNYLARGFRIVREERYVTEIPGLHP